MLIYDDFKYELDCTDGKFAVSVDLPLKSFSRQLIFKFGSLNLEFLNASPYLPQPALLEIKANFIDTQAAGSGH